MGTSFASAADVVGAMAATQWKLFESIRNLQDDRAVAAKALLGRVADALKSDQHVTALGPVLRIEQSKAIDLLTPPRSTASHRLQPPITAAGQAARQAWQEGGRQRHAGESESGRGGRRDRSPSAEGPRAVRWRGSTCPG